MLCAETGRSSALAVQPVDKQSENDEVPTLHRYSQDSKSSFSFLFSSLLLEDFDFISTGAGVVHGFHRVKVRGFGAAAVVGILNWRGRGRGGGESVLSRR